MTVCLIKFHNPHSFLKFYTCRFSCRLDCDFFPTISGPLSWKVCFDGSDNEPCDFILLSKRKIFEKKPIKEYHLNKLWEDRLEYMWGYSVQSNSFLFSQVHNDLKALLIINSTDRLLDNHEFGCFLQECSATFCPISTLCVEKYQQRLACHACVSKLGWTLGGLPKEMQLPFPLKTWGLWIAHGPWQVILAWVCQSVPLAYLCWSYAGTNDASVAGVHTSSKHTRFTKLARGRIPVLLACVCGKEFLNFARHTCSRWEGFLFRNLHTCCRAAFKHQLRYVSDFLWILRISSVWWPFAASFVNDGDGAKKINLWYQYFSLLWTSHKINTRRTGTIQQSTREFFPNLSHDSRNILPK